MNYQTPTYYIKIISEEAQEDLEHKINHYFRTRNDRWFLHDIKMIYVPEYDYNHPNNSNYEETDKHFSGHYTAILIFKSLEV